MQTLDVSVVISTYNRGDRLPLALDALLTQTGAVPYEVIVVDNNSTDDTKEVVSGIAVRSNGRLRYVFEPRQGLSYGRNTGIGVARAPIIALTDDDVRVGSDWIAQIKKAFDERPDIDYVGGRVLPKWLAPPPSWLTDSHWAPLALQDYGEAPMVVGRERAICLVGANLAFRRRVFEQVGVFTPALGRVRDGIGSTEDHDMQLRAWRAGLSGLYVPAIEATADVTPDRMVKAYHWRWHAGHGRHCAMMRLREFVPADLGPLSEPPDLILFFGSPAFVYAELARSTYRWIQALVLRKDALFYAHQVRHVCSYIQTRAALHWSESGRGILAEVTTAIRAYVAKRLRRRIAHRPSHTSAPQP